ncbi:MAG: nucleoside kinase [Muribaculaceae bacterium]|nr:nucleoside kinase [Muribaculaceae bacterium]
MKTLSVYCRNTSQYIEVDGGSTLLEIYNGHLRDKLDFVPICAHVNNKNESLSFAIFQPKEVEFLPITSASGRRVYTRSLCMMLYRAATKLYPGVHLRIEHSISHGYYCLLSDSVKINEETVKAIKEEMRILQHRDIPFEHLEMRTEEVKELFDRQGLTDKTLLLDTVHSLYTPFYRLDGICDSYYGCLAPSTGHMKTFDLRPYKDGLLLLGTASDNADLPAQPVAQEKMYKAFTEYVDFNHIVGVSNVGELNRHVLKHKAADLVNVSEALHEKYISRISDEITRRYHEGGARIVLIAGPSSSGKTTTTKRLAIQLMTNLLKPKMISLDNYFVDRHMTPRDESGDYDYESLYALDLDQFNTDLNRILNGEEIELPTYDFTTGRRTYKGNRLKLDPNSVLLIEGIHGLNPALTSHIEDRMKFRVYVSALTTISIDDHNWVPTTDNRLLRRIIRDYKYRGASATDTIARWPSVRAGEEKWIFPYQENADATFNSSLLFELGVMRDIGERILCQVPRDVPQYAEAYRLRKFLSYFVPISSSSIPSTSLLREFLGGSSFHY